MGWRCRSRHICYPHHPRLCVLGPQGAQEAPLLIQEVAELPVHHRISESEFIRQLEAS